MSVRGVPLNQITVGSFEHPTHEGFLLAHEDLKNWKKRWVVLKDRKIYLFKDPKPPTPLKRMVDLTGYMIELVDDQVLVKKLIDKDELAIFRLFHETKPDEMFCAIDERNLQEWFNSILLEYCREYVRQSTAVDFSVLDEVPDFAAFQARKNLTSQTSSSVAESESDEDDYYEVIELVLDKEDENKTSNESQGKERLSKRNSAPVLSLTKRNSLEPEPIQNSLPTEPLKREHEDFHNKPLPQPKSRITMTWEQNQKIIDTNPSKDVKNEVILEIERERERLQVEHENQKHQDLEKEKNEKAQQEVDRKKKEQEEQEKKKKEKEEQDKKKKEQEEIDRKKKEQEEIEKKKKEQLEVERKKKEQEDIEKKKKEQEEIDRKKKEQIEAEKKKREQDEAEKKRKEEEAERNRREQEKKEMQERRQTFLKLEEKQKKEQEEAEKKRKEQEEEKKKREQEAINRKKKEEEELAKKKHEQEVEEKKRVQLELDKKKEEEERKRKEKEEEEKKNKEQMPKKLDEKRQTFMKVDEKKEPKVSSIQSEVQKEIERERLRLETSQNQQTGTKTTIISQPEKSPSQPEKTPSQIKSLPQTQTQTQTQTPQTTQSTQTTQTPQTTQTQSQLRTQNQFRSSAFVTKTKSDIGFVNKVSDNPPSSATQSKPFATTQNNRIVVVTKNNTQPSAQSPTRTQKLFSVKPSNLKEACVDWINSRLSEDPSLKSKLPVTNSDLASKCKDGIILCKLVNTAVSKTLDDRAINMDSLSNPSKIEENFNLCLNSGKSIGCTFPPTTLKSLKDGNEEAIIATIVQFIKVYLRSRFKIMYDGDDLQESCGFCNSSLDSQYGIKGSSPYCMNCIDNPMTLIQLFSREGSSFPKSANSPIVFTTTEIPAEVKEVLNQLQGISTKMKQLSDKELCEGKGTQMLNEMKSLMNKVQSISKKFPRESYECVQLYNDLAKQIPDKINAAYKTAGNQSQQKTVLVSGKCAKCQNALSGDVVEVFGSSYHQTCFGCYECGRSLGKSCLNIENRPYCERCGKKAFIQSRLKNRNQ